MQNEVYTIYSSDDVYNIIVIVITYGLRIVLKITE